MNISILDGIILIAYILFVLGLGVYLSKKEGAEGYFVNNRKTKLFLLIFTALSTSVGAGSVIGVASASFSSGISFGLTFLIASALGWGLAGYLAPQIKEFGDEHKAFTFGDYLAAQYSKRTRFVSRWVVVIAYFFATAIQFVAFAQLINVATNISFIPALLIVSILTVAYTTLAGVKGDFYTDALQFFVMVPVFVFLLINGFDLISWSELTTLPEGFLSAYNYSGPLFFWAGILFGFPLILTAVESWQRIFAATDQKTARRAFYWSGVLKVVFIAISIIIGLLAFQLVPDAPADGSIFALMAELLPTGMLGLGLASMLAIIMSSVDTNIMVGSATITKDFFLQKKTDASEKEVLRVGRLSAALFGLGGLLVALLVQDIVALSLISVQVLLLFTPAFLGGLVWKIKNEKAAFWSISLGLIATLAILPFSVNFAFVPGLIASLGVYLYFVLQKNEKKISS